MCRFSTTDNQSARLPFVLTAHMSPKAVQITLYFVAIDNQTVPFL